MKIFLYHGNHILDISVFKKIRIVQQPLNMVKDTKYYRYKKKWWL